jgi:hypothetical protein
MFYVDEDDRVVGRANIAVTQGGEMVASPDAVLLQACAAARAAAAACNGETEKDDPGDIDTLLDREVAALRRVAGIKARTAHGVVEKQSCFRTVPDHSRRLRWPYRWRRTSWR